MIGPELGEVLLGVLFMKIPAGNASGPIVVAKGEHLDVGKVREGGRDLPREVILVKAETVQGG